MKERQQAEALIEQMCQAFGIPRMLPSGETFRVIEVFDRRTGQMRYIPYATRNLAAWLASERDLKVEIDRTALDNFLFPPETLNHVVAVGVRVTDQKTGRSFQDVGVAPLPPPPPTSDYRQLVAYRDAVANAFMIAYTKAWRRAVLNLCGLGGIDEAEVPSMLIQNGMNVHEEANVQPEEAPADVQPVPVLDSYDESVQPTPNHQPPKARERRPMSQHQRAYRMIRQMVESNEDIFERMLRTFGVTKFEDLPESELTRFIKEFAAVVQKAQKERSRDEE